MILENENKFDPFFEKYGTQYNIDPLFLKAQVKQESGFDPNAENKRSHAKGLSQFMDLTWLEWEDGTPGIQDQFKDHDPFNPEDSIRVQACYMNWLRTQVQKRLQDKNDWMNWTLSCYNWGLGFMFGYNRKGIHVQGVMERSLDWNIAAGFLPAETFNYVLKINKYYAEYRSEFIVNEIGEIKPKPIEEIK